MPKDCCNKTLKYKIADNVKLLDLGTKKILLQISPLRWLDVTNYPLSHINALMHGASMEALLALDSKITISTILEILKNIKSRGFFITPTTVSPFLREVTPIIYFQVTGKCNLDCYYCYNDKSIRSGELSFNDIISAYNLIKKHVDFSQGIHIHFHGGEPLCNWSVLKDAISFFRQKIPCNCRISLSTNATLVTKDIAEFLINNNIEIKISCDGTPIIHDMYRYDYFKQGSFTNMLNGFRNFADYKHVTFLSTLTKNSFQYFEENLSFFQDLKIPAVHFRPFYSLNGADSNLAIHPHQYIELGKYIVDHIEEITHSQINVVNLTLLLLPFLVGISANSLCNNNRCAAYSKSFFVTSDGFITGCDLLPNTPEFQIGNCLNNFFDSDKAYQLNCQCNKKDSCCCSCTWESICGGGCYANARESNQQHYSFTCAYSKAVYPYLLDKLITDSTPFEGYLKNIAAKISREKKSVF